MVVTPKIVCDTCDTKHLLKVTVGRENSQYHSFPCTECEEEIEFALENLFYGGEFRYVKNCTAADFEYGEAIQVHLNPDFGVSHKIVEAGDIFGAIFSNVTEMQRMHMEMEKELENGVIEHRAEYYNYNSEALRFYLKIWSLLSKGKDGLSEAYIKKNATTFNEKCGEPKEYYIEKFLNHIVGKYGLDIYSSLVEERNKIGLLADLIEFSKSQDVNSYDIFDEFIKHFSEFSQVFTYLNRGIEISERVKVSSTDFNRTKKYYSSAYESVAKLLYIPAGLNNYIERGDPNAFEKIDSLQKYMNTGNGDKLRCVQNNENLKKLSSCYDNHLRNASFHNKMYYNTKKSKLSFQKNSGESVSMEYKEYLVMCIKITEALAALNLFMLKELK